MSPGLVPRCRCSFIISKGCPTSRFNGPRLVVLASAAERGVRPQEDAGSQHAPGYLELLSRAIRKEGAASRLARAGHLRDPRMRETSRRVRPMPMVWREPATRHRGRSPRRISPPADTRRHCRLTLRVSNRVFMSFRSPRRMKIKRLQIYFPRRSRVLTRSCSLQCGQRAASPFQVSGQCGVP
jgi:hypothetical protein